jgi:ATP-dependent RNA helicase DDX55/SPB4
LCYQALLEHGTEAFIGFLRAYKEHQCSYIFRMEGLDVGAVARSYALLRLPKIKELRLKGDIDFVPDEIDTSLIPYKHKAREVARQKRLLVQREENERKRQAEEKSNDRKRKQQEDRQKQQQQQQQQQKKKPKGKHQHILAEWDELAREELLYKRFKKGKITKADYDRSLLRWKNEDDDLESGSRSNDGSFDSDGSDDDDAPAQQSKKARVANEGGSGNASNRPLGKKNNKKKRSRARK